MGSNPQESVVNRYLQHWDVSNLFVMGSCAFPQNPGYNPTGTVGALALWADAIKTKESRSFGAGVTWSGLCDVLGFEPPPSFRFPSRRWSVPARGQQPTFGAVERGRYLTTAGDCEACHTSQGGKPFAGDAQFQLRSGRSIPPISRQTAKPALARGQTINSIVRFTRALGPMARISTRRFPTRGTARSPARTRMRSGLIWPHWIRLKASDPPIRSTGR